MQSKNRRKRKYAAPIGGIFILFAALGVITVVYLSFKLTGAVLDNTNEKLMFENIVRPVVMFNPTPFEAPTDIENDDLLNFSMWSALLGENKDKYTFGETQELIVPASDLNVAAAKLFGPDVSLEHHSFDYFEMSYYYDEANSVYNVPVSVVFNVYTPSVETITKNGGFFELSVGFLPSGVSWQTDFSGGQGKPLPEKYMNFIMQKTKDGYCIVKVQDPVTSVYNTVPAADEQIEGQTGGQTDEQPVETSLETEN